MIKEESFLRHIVENVEYCDTHIGINKEELFKLCEEKNIPMPPRIKSFHGDNSGFEKMFNSIITSSRKEEQIQAISYLCDKESPVVKSFNYIKGISIKDKLYKAKEKSSVQKVKQIDKSKGLEK